MSKSEMKKIALYSGPIMIVIAAVLWAFDGMIRRSLYVLPPLTIVFFEHLFGSLIIAPFFLPKFKVEKLTKRVLGLTFIVALMGGLIGTIFFTGALGQIHFISFSVVYLMQKLQPIFALGSAWLLLKERLNKKYFIWAAVAAIAAYFVTFPNGYINFGTGSGTVIAALLALGAAFCWGTGTTFSKMLLKEVSVVEATGLRFFGTFAMGLIALLLTGTLGTLTAATPSQFALFILIALSTGLVALYIYYKGLQKTPVSISTFLELTFPLLAIFIDAVVYHTVLSPSQYLAAAILLFSIYKIGRLPKTIQIESVILND